jgi:hypothetical protein
MTSALAASTLGVAGTLIGAAIGSIVITVGGAIYAHTFRSAHRRIEAVVPLRSARYAARAGSPVAAAAVAAAVADASDAQRAARRWRGVATVLAGLLLALGAITVVELVIGHPLGNSSETGTTVTRVATNAGIPRARVEPAPLDPTPQPTATPTPTPSSTPSPTPSDAVTPTTPATPTPGGTPTPTGSPTPASTPTPTPTP